MEKNTITFITGNQKKADYVARYLGFPVDHLKLDLDELQSLDLRVIVAHKLQQAYEKIHSPVLVEDVSLEFAALGRLPGPFIRFFIDEVPMDTLCSLVSKDRKATARCVYGYTDGKRQEFFEGKLEGTIAEHPAGDNGYGFDKIFIPDGYAVTRAQLNEADDQKTYLQIKPLEQVKKFLLREHYSRR
ncbi:MAG: non-canonical purine NTP pyrophosphatase [Chlamydiae bacterium]|nr:non-canonical purine NTP pyrophosphatase [Chlamydiota bacterium]